MRLLASLALLASAVLAASYVEHEGKAYLLDSHDLRIVTSEGSSRVPLFGTPVTILVGSRPYVLTSQALFAVDPANEQVSAVFRLDRAYSSAVIGTDDRIYLLGADALSVVQGSAAKMSLLYTYGLPRLASSMFLLPSGELLFLPASGLSAFTYNPNTKKIIDVKLPWIPRYPLLIGSTLVDRNSLGLWFFSPSTRKSASLNLGSEPTRVSAWQGKVLAATASELVLADPASSTLLARTQIADIRKLSTIDSEGFATVLAGNSLITVSLPSLVPADTFNASCTRNTHSSAYPFFGKPLFVCGEKLALPGASQQTRSYLVQPVKITEGQAFSLQVGAFANPISFGPLMENLARQGLPYYTVKEGGLTKFRVGFFRTRAEADRFRSFLQDYGAWVIAEHSTRQLTHSLHDLNLDRRPDGIVAKADSVLVFTLSQRTWIEVLKASKLPEPVTNVYLKGNRAFAELKQSGLRELVLPDSIQ
ncbi:MAG: SPOR domain-containing protein [Candidatus Stahlbacteria bacterium]|nr:MAG: SPOR domain-containing protein [Candidatus Stahlbacteria bacterium]